MNSELDGRQKARLSPERVFVGLALFFGGLFAAVTPPNDPPDEVRHFARAYLIAEGHFAVAGRAPGYQAAIPTSLIEIHPPHANRRRDHDAAQILEALSLPLDPERRTRMLRIGLYTPLCCLPQAGAIALGRALGLPPAPLLYLGRFANVLLWAAVGWLAIRLTPVRKWALVLLSLTPAALYQAGSVSVDAPSHAFSLLWFALVARSAFEVGRRVSRRDAVLLVLIAALVGAAKPGYWPLAALVLLIPPDRFRAAAKRWTLVAVIGIAVLLPSGLWALAVRAADPAALSTGADAAAQLSFVLASPGKFLTTLLVTLGSEWLPWVAGVTGVLGQLDIALPLWLYALYPAVVLFACLADPCDPSELTARRRGGLVGLFTLGGVCMLLMAYLGWNTIASPLIVGVQGRYFIPLAPLLLLAVPAGRFPLPRLHPAAALAFSSAVLVIAAYTVSSHYYGA